MYQQLLSHLRQWSESTDDRRQLQHVYAFGGVALLFVAGLVGLVDDNLGQTLATVALATIGIFFVNAIVWALVVAFVLLRLDNQDQARTKTKPRAKK